MIKFKFRQFEKLTFMDLLSNPELHQPQFSGFSFYIRIELDPVTNLTAVNFATEF